VVLLAGTLVILALLGAYYATTLLRGAGGAKIWAVSPANMFFVGYEFLGFQGLGPGRQELRAIIKGLAPARELLPFIPGFLALGTAYFLLALAACKFWMPESLQVTSNIDKGDSHSEPTPTQQQVRRLFTAWLLGIGVAFLSACLLYLLAAAVGFPFWGRHLAGTFPFWVLSLAITIQRATRGPWKKAGELAGGGVLILILASSLLIRFAPFHKHDDYRGAAMEALRLSSEGLTVWWVADHSGGVYYGLPLAATFNGAFGEIEFAMNRSSIPQKLPGAIVISRPDNFDTKGTASEILIKGNYAKVQNLQAFGVWKRTTRQE
jgi:hypothetical protein